MTIFVYFETSILGTLLKLLTGYFWAKRTWRMIPYEAKVLFIMLSTFSGIVWISRQL
jgi:hypothetical protein